MAEPIESLDSPDSPESPDGDDTAARLASAEARIAELIELNAAIMADNQTLKARNYDLMSKAPVTTMESDDEPTEQIISIDDLFTEE